MLPNTLFFRTSLIIFFTSFTFIIFSAMIVVYYVLVPMGRQATMDSAALIALAVQTWSQLAESERAQFIQDLEQKYRIHMRTDLQLPLQQLQAFDQKEPYIRFLNRVLQQNYQYQGIRIYRSAEDPHYYWFILPLQDHQLYIRIFHKHSDTESYLIFIILLGDGIFILWTTLFIVRRITRPLENLAQGVQQLGSGQKYQPLPEDGPLELANLAKKFNLLNGEIQKLLDNRTTLLGGISHDLRTPIARMRVALELLNCPQDQDLIETMHKDLQEMDQLIERTLTLAKMMQADKQQTQDIDLIELLQSLQLQYQQTGHHFRLEYNRPIHIQANPILLSRILSNLLDNAFQYGKNVSVRIQSYYRKTLICVLDRGPGIPEEQLDKVLQPFYRLDPSRNRRTGGNGLGLAIVQQLAQIQGWRIRLSNRPQGGLAACIEMSDH